MASRHPSEPRTPRRAGPAADYLRRRARSFGDAVSRRLLFLVSLVVVLTSVLATAMVSQARPVTPNVPAAQNINWWQGADMPAPREYLALAASDSRVYAVGGLSDAGWEARIDEYNPSTNTWAFKTNMPSARLAHGAAVVNNKLYVIGGMKANDSNQSQSVEMLDLNTNYWYTLNPLPTGRRDFALAVMGNFIFVVGGTRDGDGNGTLRNLEVLDTNTNTWQILASMPTGRRYLAAAAYGGKVYAFGGVDDQQDNRIEVFDPSYNAWSTLGTTMAGGRFSFGAATIADRIYLVGGRNVASYFTNWVDEFNPQNNTVDIYANDLITYRANHGTTSIGNRIYVAGGYATDSNQNNGYKPTRIEIGEVAGGTPGPGTPSATITPTPSGGARSLSWITGAPMPAPRSFLGVAASSSRVYATGGLSDGGWEARIDEYNPDTNTWAFKTNMLSARIAHGAAVVNNRLYIIGGMKSGDSNQSQSVEMLDLNTNYWYTVNPLPTGRRDFALAVMGNFIFVVGGTRDGDGNGTMKNLEVLDTNTNTWQILASMPTGRRYLAAAAAGGKVYAFGGVDDMQDNRIEVFDPTYNAWSTLGTTVPGGRFGFGAVPLEGHIYLVGGRNMASYFTNWVDEFDPNYYTIYDATDAIRYRSEHGVAVIGNRIFAVGGWVTDTNSNNGSHDPYIDIGTVQLPSTPTATPSPTIEPSPTITPTPRICPTMSPWPTGVPITPQGYIFIPLARQDNCPY